MPTPTKDQIEQAGKIIASAQRDLGKDLSGHSAVDLLADNMELPLETLRAILKFLFGPPTTIETAMAKPGAQVLLIVEWGRSGLDVRRCGIDEGDGFVSYWVQAIDPQEGVPACIARGKHEEYTSPLAALKAIDGRFYDFQLLTGTHFPQEGA